MLAILIVRRGYLGLFKHFCPMVGVSTQKNKTLSFLRFPERNQDSPFHFCFLQMLEGRMLK
jgi:hypothetical protein